MDQPIDVPDMPEPEGWVSPDSPEIPGIPEISDEADVPIEIPENSEVSMPTDETIVPTIESTETIENTGMDVATDAPLEIPELDNTDDAALDPQEAINISEEPQLNGTGDSSADEDAEVQQAVDKLSEMDNLDPEAWDSLNSNERMEVLQDVEDTMAEIQDRPPVQVIIDDSLESNTFGGYDGEVIRINADHLQSDMPVDEFIDTIVHEGRHAYQDNAINNPRFDNDTEQVNSWAENNENYLKPEDYGQEIYANQPVEADAWSYATQIRNTLVATNWS